MRHITKCQMVMVACGGGNGMLLKKGGIALKINS